MRDGSEGVIEEGDLPCDVTVRVDCNRGTFEIFRPQGCALGDTGWRPAGAPLEDHSEHVFDGLSGQALHLAIGTNPRVLAAAEGQECSVTILRYTHARAPTPRKRPRANAYTDQTFGACSVVQPA